MSSPPGGTIPWWWHWRACSPPTGVLRTATKPEIIQSSLLLSLLVNAPMLHRACSTIIVNPNIKVKFQTNEHLKKVFSEQFELFWTKSRQVDLKHQLPSTFIKFMVTIKNYQNTKSNENVCGCLLSRIFNEPLPEHSWMTFWRIGNNRKCGKQFRRSLNPHKGDRRGSLPHFLFSAVIFRDDREGSSCFFLSLGSWTATKTVFRNKNRSAWEECPPLFAKGN